MVDNDVAGFVKQNGAAWALYFTSATDTLAVNNRINDADFGIHYDSSTGKYRDNLTRTTSVPYTGGTDIGNNN